MIDYRTEILKAVKADLGRCADDLAAASDAVLRGQIKESMAITARHLEDIQEHGQAGEWCLLDGEQWPCKSVGVLYRGYCTDLPVRLGSDE